MALLDELKRRKAFRVAAAYVSVSCHIAEIRGRSTVQAEAVEGRAYRWL
jgi:hypothetical protein